MGYSRRKSTHQFRARENVRGGVIGQGLEMMLNWICDSQVRWLRLGNLEGREASLVLKDTCA